MDTDRDDGVVCSYQSHCTESYVSSYLSRYHSVDTDGGSSFGVDSSDVKGGVLTRTSHLYSQRSNFWFSGGYFVSSHSIHYPYMSYYNKYRPHSPLSLRRNYRFSISGDGRFGVVLSTNKFSSHKSYVGTDRHDGGFNPPQYHLTASPSVPSLSKYC